MTPATIPLIPALTGAEKVLPAHLITCCHGAAREKRFLSATENKNSQKRKQSCRDTYGPVFGNLLSIHSFIHLLVSFLFFYFFILSFFFLVGKKKKIMMMQINCFRHKYHYHHHYLRVCYQMQLWPSTAASPFVSSAASRRSSPSPSPPSPSSPSIT